MKILITGDRGFVGTETRRYIESMGESNINPTSGITTTIHQHQVIGFDIMDTLDIRDMQQFEAYVMREQPDRILHLAAIARFSDADKDPLLAFETNVHGTLNVSTIARKYHIPLVYASTGSVYMPIHDVPPITEKFAAIGNSVYGCTKRMGELYVERVSPFIILRYAHLYGKEKRMHGLIGGYIERIKRGLSPTLYGGKQSNDFTYVKDVARANYLAITAPWDKWNQVYNIGTGEELTAKEAGELVIQEWNKANPKNQFKGKVEIKEQRTVDPDKFVFDIKKAKDMLDFKAEYNFEQGLKDMFKTYAAA